MSHNWAQVELFRWQYGELPVDESDTRPLDVPLALEKMAAAVREGEVQPFSVATVFSYCAALLREKN